MSIKLYSKYLFFSAALIVSNSVQGQVVFATETFGTGAAKGTSANGFVGDLGTWTSATSGANGASSNQWYVSGEECGNAVNTCGSGCPGGDNSLHVSAIGGLCGTPDCGAAYDETSAANQTNRRAISPTIDCTGKTGISLNFNYIAAQGDDDFFVEYSLDNGGTWNAFTGGTPAASLCCPCFDAFLCAIIGFCCGGAPTVCSGSDQGYWTALTLAFPAGADNNPNVKFAYRWSNNGNGVGTDPSVAIDDITLTYDAVLAVELSQFYGEPQENRNYLNWSTLSEINSDRFVVEHSTDGINFREVGEVIAKGNSSSVSDYQFIHETNSVQNYYRLKMIDFDGGINYSELIFIQNDLEGILLSHVGTDFLILGLQDLEGSISVYDLSGQNVTPTFVFNRDQENYLINLDHLTSGIYIISVNASNGVKNFKILK